MLKKTWFLLRWRDHATGEETLTTHWVPADWRRSEWKERCIIEGQEEGLVYVGEER